MTPSDRQARHIAWGYLAREAGLILLLGYILLLGGGPAGQVVTPARLVNTALLALVSLIWLPTRLSKKRRPFPATPLDAVLLVFLAASVPFPRGLSAVNARDWQPAASEQMGEI